MSDGRCSGGGGGAGRAVQDTWGREGEGRTLQIHFRPAATARHASERKLAAASERVSRRAARRART